VRIRLTTLGHVRCHLDDRELTELHDRPFWGAVLLYLAIERKASRETIQDVLWDDVVLVN
jgi:DNA-binding SARP family transcriptional activator